MTKFVYLAAAVHVRIANGFTLSFFPPVLVSLWNKCDSDELVQGIFARDPMLPRLLRALLCQRKFNEIKSKFIVVCLLSMREDVQRHVFNVDEHATRIPL